MTRLTADLFRAAAGIPTARQANIQRSELVAAGQMVALRDGLPDRPE
jgi:hypothetical protein